MTYTFTEEQLNNLIDEVMQLASEGVTFERWEVSERQNARLLTDMDGLWEKHETPIWIDENGGEIADTWYFYPEEGDSFTIDDLDSIKQLKQ